MSRARFSQNYDEGRPGGENAISLVVGDWARQRLAELYAEYSGGLTAPVSPAGGFCAVCGVAARCFARAVSKLGTGGAFGICSPQNTLNPKIHLD